MAIRILNVAGARPNFSWSPVAEATSYVMELRTAADAWVGTRTTNGTALTRPFTLEADESYKWRIYASDNISPSEWSAETTFTATPLDPPVQIAPAGAVDGNRPDFSWNAVDDAEFYVLHLYTAADEWVGAQITSGTSLTRPFTLQLGQSYKWHIYASANQGPGEWSDFLDFTINP